MRYRRSSGAAALRRKMDLYRRNGAQLGWLLLPAQQAMEIWYSNSAKSLCTWHQLDAGNQSQV